MRRLPRYTWDEILDEPFMRTQVTIEMMEREDEREAKNMPKKRGK